MSDAEAMAEVFAEVLERLDRIEQALLDMARYATVHEVLADDAKIRVRYPSDDDEPDLSAPMRFGPFGRGVYSPPRVGEQVLVVAPGGDLSQASAWIGLSSTDGPGDRDVIQDALDHDRETGDLALAGGSGGLVALAAKVDAELSKIQTTLGTGAAPSGGGAVTFSTPYAPAAVAAEKVSAT